MGQMTRQLLEATLRNLKGTVIATVTVYSDARARKTGNPFGKIFKRTKINGVLNFKYVNSVNNQRVREGGTPDFVPAARAWGVRIEGTPIVEHKGNVYVEMKVERCLSTEYFDDSGSPLSEKHVKDYLPQHSSSAEHQGVEKEIILRDINIENIEAITVSGNTWEIV